jgi:molecular chaperone DnaK
MTTYVHLPLLESEEVLGREQLDALIAPLIARTLTGCRAALRNAGVTPAAIYLTGGSSRIPAVTTALHQRFGVAPRLIDQPELAVAEGAVSDGAAAVSAPGAPAAETPTPVSPAAELPATPGPVAFPSVANGGAAVRRTRGDAGLFGWWSRWTPGRRVALEAAAIMGVAVALVVAAVTAAGDDAERGAAAAPTPSLAPGLDACLIGTWDLSSVRVTLDRQGHLVEFTGNGGQRVTFRPDGTTVTVFDDLVVRATPNGEVWEQHTLGGMNARYRVSSGTLTYSEIENYGSYWFTLNGVRQDSGSLRIGATPEQYTCSDDALTLGASRYTQEFTRVS